MAKAVLTHRAGSIYDDRPEEHYQFPATYLRQVEQAIGDWVIYYEPRRDGGRQAYFATARVAEIEPDPAKPGLYYAHIRDYLDFARPVPFREDARTYYESILRKDDGSASKGAFGRAVRIIPDHEFDAVVRSGLSADAAETVASRDLEAPEGFAEPLADFERPMVERLTLRPFRDAAFARQVKSAYGNRCALTGLSLRNGGGRAEVQAAHIRPVERDGPDTVRNGVALSGTAHWMFDRGLVSIADDGQIIIADGKVPADAVERLIVPERRLLMPTDPRAMPHPVYLKYHREHIFGRSS